VTGEVSCHEVLDSPLFLTGSVGRLIVAVQSNLQRAYSHSQLTLWQGESTVLAILQVHAPWPRNAL